MSDFEKKILKKLDKITDLLISIDKKLNISTADLDLPMDDFSQRAMELMEMSEKLMKQALGSDDVDDIYFEDHRKKEKFE